MENKSVLDPKIGCAFRTLSPSQWDAHFLYIDNDEKELNSLSREIEVLKSSVKSIFMSSSQGDKPTKRRIVLIHLLVNLGLAYHFEKEIEETLRKEFEKIHDLTMLEDDLYTISIMFRVFRSYGHNMSSDVFKKFKGDDAKFEEFIVKDVKTMLSLYEAANYRTKNEDILEEAFNFTLTHLEDSLTTKDIQIQPHLSKLIKSVIFLPQNHNMGALIARQYIIFYEQEEDHDHTLLQFSKLNFKYMQLHWVQELKIITKWWKELGLQSKLPTFHRERILESWFCGLMSYFEPHFSLGRIIETKLIIFFLIFDDICDEYGSLPDCERLVGCLERWDSYEMDDLNEYLKGIFRVVLNVFQELEREVKWKGGSYHLEEMLEEFKILQRANLTQVKWARGKHVPSFEEYLEVGGCSITCYACIAASFVGMGEIASKEAYKWLKSRPKLVKAVASKMRLADDLMDVEEDKIKGYVANGVNCYMKQYGVSEKEAIQEIHKIIGDFNKIVNEEMLKIIDVPRQVLIRVFNTSVFTNVVYTIDDAYNCREGKFKDHIISLFEDLTHL